jgi:hypothetical protein
MSKNPTLINRTIKGHTIMLKHGARGLYFVVDGKTKYIPGEVLHMDDAHVQAARAYINTYLTAQGILTPAPATPAPMPRITTCKVCGEGFYTSMVGREITGTQGRAILKLVDTHVLTPEQVSTIKQGLLTKDRYWASYTIHYLANHITMKENS